MASVEDQLNALARMQLSGLRHEWERVTGGTPPPVSAALLRLAKAYEPHARKQDGMTRYWLDAPVIG